MEPCFSQVALSALTPPVFVKGRLKRTVGGSGRRMTRPRHEAVLIQAPTPLEEFQRQ